MATATANIPYGSILSQLRARQQQEWQIKEEKKKKKAAFTNQLVQLGGMAVGGALAGPLGMGVMAGVGAGGLAGGLAGNAMTGTPVSMNQGIGAAMQVGGLMDRNARTDIAADRTMLDEGYVRLGEDLLDEPMADDRMYGGNMYTPGGMGGRGSYQVTTKGIDANGNEVSVRSKQSSMPNISPTIPSSGGSNNQEKGVQWGDQSAITPEYTDEATRLRWQREEEERQRLLERGMGFGTKY